MRHSDPIGVGFGFKYMFYLLYVTCGILALCWGRMLLASGTVKGRGKDLVLSDMRRDRWLLRLVIGSQLRWVEPALFVASRSRIGLVDDSKEAGLFSQALSGSADLKTRGPC